ncbi:MAG: hypothetical protein AAGI46_08605 [Planctomycetota bacterium]
MRYRRSIRQLPFILLAYVALGLQRGLEPFLTHRFGGGGWAQVDLPYVAAAGIAAMVPRESAGVAAFLVGLAHDVTAGGPIGPRAVGYGLAGLIIARSQPRSPAVFAGLASAGAIVAALVVWLLIALGGGRQTIVGGSTTGLFTAAVAALMAWPTWKLRTRLSAADRRL